MLNRAEKNSLLILSLAEYAVPDLGIYKSFTDVNGSGVFDAYPTVLALLAKQRVKVLSVKVIHSLATEVF